MTPETMQVPKASKELPPHFPLVINSRVRVHTSKRSQWNSIRVTQSCHVLWVWNSGASDVFGPHQLCDCLALTGHHPNYPSVTPGQRPHELPWFS